MKVNRDHFYKLASDLKEERLQASIAIVTDLTELDGTKADAEREEWQYVINRLIRGLASNRSGARLGFSLCLTEVLNLALERGISLEVNGTTNDTVGAEWYLELLSENTVGLTGSKSKAKGSKGNKLKGKEERGLLFGKLFGLKALLNDPLFERIFLEVEPNENKETTKRKNCSVSREFTELFVKHLVDLAQKKNWIREPCLFTLYQALERLLPYIEARDKDIIESMLLQLDEFELTLTNEGLAIYLLLLQEVEPFEQLRLDLKHGNWKLNNPLARGNLPLLAKVLANSAASPPQPPSGGDDEETPNTQVNVKPTNWNPRLHFVWDRLLPQLIYEKTPDGSSNHEDQRHSNKKRRKNSSDKGFHSQDSKQQRDPQKYIRFPEFWQVVVDETFFNSKASSERKYLGFLIIEKTMQLFAAPSQYSVPSEFVEDVFSNNVLRSLINQSFDSKRLLHKIAQKVLNSITKACELNPDVLLVPCLHALLFGPNGSINFDKLTKSKTISKLLTSIRDLSPETLVAMITLLTENINTNIENPEDEKEHLVKIQFILDSLLHIARSHKNKIPADYVASNMLKPIIKLSFFTKHFEKVSTLARERLYSILGELTSSANSAADKKYDHTWQYRALSIILELENESDGSDMNTPFDEQLTEVKQSALEILTDIASRLADANFEGTKMGKAKISELLGMESLLSMCLLQMYSGDSESVSIIQELSTFYSEGSVFSRRQQQEQGKKTKRKKGSSEEKEEAEPEGGDANGSMLGFTEILLSLMAKKKMVLRKLSLLVWQQFIENIGSKELVLLLDVLDVKENKGGLQELFEGADEMEDVADEEEMEGEENGNDSDSEDESSDGGNDESGSDNEEEEDEEEEEEDNMKDIDKETATALAKVLKLPKNIVKPNGEISYGELDNLSGGENDEDGDEDEESLDDEQMMELDDELSEIFRRRKEALSGTSSSRQRKLEAKESREDVISFKHRVIDMLEIYVKYVEQLDSVDEQISQNLLLLIKPMIKCVRKTTDKSLVDRISKLLKNRVFKIKVSGITKETCRETLQAIHESLLASKPGQFHKAYFSLCSTASIFFAKQLVGENPSDDAYNELIDLYASTTKKWRTSGNFGINVFIEFLNWLDTRKRQ